LKQVWQAGYFLQPAQGFGGIIAVDAEITRAAGLAQLALQSGVNSRGCEQQLAFAAARCVLGVQLGFNLATEFSVGALHLQG